MRVKLWKHEGEFLCELKRPIQASTPKHVSVHTGSHVHTKKTQKHTNWTERSNKSALTIYTHTFNTQTTKNNIKWKACVSVYLCGTIIFNLYYVLFLSLIKNAHYFCSYYSSCHEALVHSLYGFRHYFHYFSPVHSYRCKTMCMHLLKLYVKCFACI